MYLIIESQNEVKSSSYLPQESGQTVSEVYRNGRLLWSTTKFLLYKISPKIIHLRNISSIKYVLSFGERVKVITQRELWTPSWKTAQLWWWARRTLWLFSTTLQRLRKSLWCQVREEKKKKKNSWQLFWGFDQTRHSIAIILAKFLTFSTVVLFFS